MRWLRALAAVALAVGLGSVPAAAMADDGGNAGRVPIWKDGQTVVSFTFDGGYKDQQVAAEILARYNMAGTFYVNSGYIGYPAYMSLDDLRAVARNRSEIGGGGLYNNDLTKMAPDRAKQEVCDDRATLSQLGFQVTSFSYPYGNDLPANAKLAVEQCGYNNGRGVARLWAGPEECASCPHAESLPPVDDFRIRTLGQSNDPGYIEQHILGAERNGGGWMPLVFSHLCVCTSLGEEGITPRAFEQLVKWVHDQPEDQVKVLTMDQVMQGDLKPITGNPLHRLMPAGLHLPKQSLPPSQRDAWTLAGFGVTQSTLVMLGLMVAIAVIITFRVATRGKKYVQSN